MGPPGPFQPSPHSHAHTPPTARSLPALRDTSRCSGQPFGSSEGPFLCGAQSVPPPAPTGGCWALYDVKPRTAGASSTFCPQTILKRQCPVPAESRLGLCQQKYGGTGSEGVRASLLVHSAGLSQHPVPLTCHGRRIPRGRCPQDLPPPDHWRKWLSLAWSSNQGNSGRWGSGGSDRAITRVRGSLRLDFTEDMDQRFPLFSPARARGMD